MQVKADREHLVHDGVIQIVREAVVIFDQGLLRVVRDACRAISSFSLCVGTAISALCIGTAISAVPEVVVPGRQSNSLSRGPVHRLSPGLGESSTMEVDCSAASRPRAVRASASRMAKSPGASTVAPEGVVPAAGAAAGRSSMPGSLDPTRVAGRPCPERSDLPAHASSGCRQDLERRVTSRYVTWHSTENALVHDGAEYG
jgi:hypothetical protein